MLKTRFYHESSKTSTLKGDLQEKFSEKRKAYSSIMYKSSYASLFSGSCLKGRIEGIESKKRKNGGEYSIVKIGGEDYFVGILLSLRLKGRLYSQISVQREGKYKTITDIKLAENLEDSLRECKSRIVA